MRDDDAHMASRLEWAAERWRAVRARIDRLASLDRRLVAFGAKEHRYEFRSPLGEDEILDVERDLACRLPLELRTLYSTLGDGGAGPDYGIVHAAALDPIEPTQAFAGVDVLRGQYATNEDPPGYFEVPEGALSGLLGIGQEGCGHRTCIVTSGTTVGSIVHVSADGCVGDGAPSLIAHYQGWLDETIAPFEAALEAMNGTVEFRAIEAMLKVEFPHCNPSAIVASIANRATEHVHRGVWHPVSCDDILAEWRQPGRNGASDR